MLDKGNYLVGLSMEYGFFILQRGRDPSPGKSDGILESG